MRLYIPAIIAVLSISIIARGNAQEAFQNLDFEGAFPAIQPSSPPGFYSTTVAFPGWTIYYGNEQGQSVPQSQTTYEQISTGETYVGLLGTTGPTIFTAISGRFSALIQGGVTASDASIRQTGTIPAGSESIEFESSPISDAGSFLLSFEGHDISYYALSQGPNYTLYGGDISAFAGQTGELEFSALEGPNNWEVDSIVFSPNSVPEPSVWSLILCGTVFFGFTRLKGGGP
ncbi:MAG TPA: hypothetical protein VH413_13680 [Verrucomicrobiae bacterium]|jgi:hypothetical protein|nr:hypothetical protein [Verrucomicrobiae bacterium]